MSTRVAFGIVVAIVTGVAATDIAHGASLRPSAKPPAMATGSPAAATSAVKATFSEALEAAAEFGSPTAAYQQAALAAVQSRHAVPPFTAAQRTDLRAAGQAAIARYFGPPQSAAELTALDKAMALDADPDLVNLGSGLSKVAFRTLTVTSSQATVVADATVWAKSAALQAQAGRWLVASPVKVLRCTAALHLAADGTWRVTSLTIGLRSSACLASARPRVMSTSPRPGQPTVSFGWRTRTARCPRRRDVARSLGR